jgi:uncharacterized protein YdhG (YjbR/CyaY superfamily)
MVSGAVDPHTDGSTLVDAHLAALPEPQRSTLTALRATLRRVLPHGEECIKYAMPCIAVRGKGVAGYDGFKDHCSYFPMSGKVLGVVEGLPAGWVSTKGTLHFPVDTAPPAALVRRLVKARLADIADVASGKRLEFFDDGALKAEGSMRDGQLHGSWRWYRRDGSLMRTGRFRDGQQVGRWETYDADGVLVRATSH